MFCLFLIFMSVHHIYSSVIKNVVDSCVESDLFQDPSLAQVIQSRWVETFASLTGEQLGFVERKRMNEEESVIPKKPSVLYSL